MKLTEIEFEDQLTDAVIATLQCTRGDAQGIVEANETFWIDEWQTGATPSQVADLIL